MSFQGETNKENVGVSAFQRCDWSETWGACLVLFANSKSCRLQPRNWNYLCVFLRSTIFLCDLFTRTVSTSRFTCADGSLHTTPHFVKCEAAIAAPALHATRRELSRLIFLPAAQKRTVKFRRFGAGRSSQVVLVHSLPSDLISIVS